MAKTTLTGPLGTPSNAPVVDPGTTAQTANMPPRQAGQDPDPSSVPPLPGDDPIDPLIEALDLEPTARAAAYALKAAQPTVTFTSGRRSKADQARAMAGNVVSNRKWIEQTYKKSALRKQLQDWVNDNPDEKTKAEIAAGLLSVFNEADDADALKFSLHMTGMAFDVQPVTKNAAAIKKSIRALTGLSLFLEMEGGKVRWHAQFKDDPPDEPAKQ